MKIKELGKTPIREDAPAGEDAHYEPEFEALQQEIDKLSIASVSGEGIDWKRVTQLAFTILSEKSKDILVAAYLGIGLVHTHKFDGLVAGSVVLNDLVNNFWDNMFPPKRRLRGRFNAISWWEERVKTFLQNFETDPLPVESVENLKNTVSALDASLAEKSDSAPNLRELLNYLDRLPQQEPEPDPNEVQEAQAQAAQIPDPESVSGSSSTAEAPITPTPTSTPTSTPQATPVPVSTPAATPKAVAPVGNVKSLEDAASAFKQSADQLLTISDCYLKNDPSNPISYKLMRMAAWSGIHAAPPAQGGKTMLPPPDSMIKSSIEHLASANNCQAALIASEERIVQFKFWLDLSRLTAQSLEQLGYAAASDQVAVDTLLYVQRIGGLDRLAFSDGTPFADQETRAWLKTIGLGAGSGEATAGGSGPEADVEAALANARKLVKDKKTVDAVQLMDDGLNSTASGRERLLWRISLSKLFIYIGKMDLAGPLVDEILKDIKEFKLESWDPALALNGLATAYEILDGAQNENTQQKAKDVLAIITRVSPSETLRITGAT